MTVWTADAVLFDMDGTLIDSTPAVMRSWRTWGRRWGQEAGFEHTDHGVPARAIVARLVPGADHEAAFRDIEALEVADTDGIRVLPGAEALLHALPAEAWAIVTSCSTPLAEARLRSVGIRPPVLVTADDTPVGKPAPDPFLAAAARLGVDPARCIVVEDAPAGLLAGRAAGARTIGVRGTVADLDADAVVDSLVEVTAVTRAGGGVQVTILG